MPYITLLRPSQWVKNLFIFIPLFFSGRLFDVPAYGELFIGFLAFSFTASAIYIINDYRDIEDDKLHPTKKNRPLASGKVNKNIALIICALLLIVGFALAWYLKPKFLFVLGLYFVINLCYSLGLKKIPILDVMLVAVGFVLRVKAGGVITNIAISEWLNIMVFLLALFMAVGKRRDDVLLKLSSGKEMRKSISGYNLEFLNVATSLICAVIMVAYIMYTMSPDVQERFTNLAIANSDDHTPGAYRLYYTCLFVLAGLLRYLQIIFVQEGSGSPTKIFLKDRFIQIVVVLWVLSFYFIIYVNNITLFS